jgi:hypothetical protein
MSLHLWDEWNRITHGRGRYISIEAVPMPCSPDRYLNLLDDKLLPFLVKQINLLIERGELNVVDGIIVRHK